MIDDLVNFFTEQTDVLKSVGFTDDQAGALLNVIQNYFIFVETERNNKDIEREIKENSYFKALIKSIAGE